MSEAQSDKNRVRGLIAETNDSNRTPTPLIVDPVSQRLLVNSTISGAITATIDTAGLATDTKQSDGSQKTQVVDGSGNVIGATSNALDVNIKSGASSGTQYTDAAATPAHPIGTMPVFDSGGAISEVSLTKGLPVNVVAGGAGGGAMTVADGADVTLGAKADAKSTATDTTAITAMSVLKEISYMEQNPASRAVTGSVTANAGTNLNTSTLAIETGGNLAAIKAKTDNIPAQGQALAAASLPVILPSATVTTLTPPAAITGFALEAGHLATIDTNTGKIPSQGQALAAASTPVVLTAAQVSTLTPPAAIAGFTLEAGHAATIDTSTAAVNTLLGAKTDAKSVSTDATSVSAMQVLKQISASVQAPPAQTVTFTGSGDAATQTTLAAINTKLVTGTDIGDVTINNSTGASAVNIQDGGNSITIDGAVTTSGTVAATLGAETTKVIGTVNQGTSPWVVSGATTNTVLSVVGTGTEATAQRVTIATDSTGVLSVDDNGASLTVDNPTISVVGTGTEATAQRVTIATDSTGVLSVDDNGGALTVDNGGTFAVQAAATLTAETTKVIGTINVAAAQTIGITANSSINNAQINAHTTLEGGVNGSQSVGGTGAESAAVTGNPINNGGTAVTAEKTACHNGDAIGLVADLVGKLIVLPYANPENFVSGATAAITDTTNTSVIASAGGALRNYITHILVTNSHATVGTVVEIRDGATTVIYRGYAAALGGGFALTLNVPLRGTAATAVTASCITTGSNVYVSASGYKGL